MTRTLAALFVWMVTVGGPGQAPVGEQQTTVFRSNAELVSVPVFVRQKNRPVAGLTSADFEVRDNGIPQALTSTAIELLPLDITLVLDASGSVRDRLENLKREIREIAGGLEPNDRLRLVSFATTVAQVFELRSGASEIPLDTLAAGGGTALYNALGAALMTLPDTTRPQLVFAFTDGLDTVSFLDADRVQSLAGFASAAVYIGVVDTEQARAIPASNSGGVARVRKPLQDLAERTGGALVIDPSGSGLSRAFDRAVEEFRTSYMLRYTPTGVRTGGWHEIAVKVARPGSYDVRARRGYEGG